MLVGVYLYMRSRVNHWGCSIQLLLCLLNLGVLLLVLFLSFPQNGPNGEVINPECVVEQVDSSRYDLLLKVEDNGHYVGCVKYQDQRIGPPNFTIICLSGTYILVRRCMDT